MPLPPITDDDWDAVRESLRMMASTINRLRKRVDALEAGATPSTAPAAPAAPTEQTSTFVPMANCAMCDKIKEPGRLSLTCEECAALRNRIISTKGADRSPIMRDSCFCCSAPFKRSARFLCASCSAGFKVWKASH